MGKGLDALLDLYNKEGEELATTHARLLLDLRNRPRTQRYGHHTSFEKDFAGLPSIDVMRTEDHS